MLEKLEKDNEEQQKQKENLYWGIEFRRYSTARRPFG